MVTKRFTTLKVKMPEELLENINLLVEAGLYPNRNEALREAIRQQLEAYA